MSSSNIRDELLIIARELAAKRAYCPYSNFHVGCALQDANGKIYRGVNVEISSYGLTLCAERSALSAAIADGAGPITHLAVACIDVPADAPAHQRTICGACLQWISDLAPDATIYIDGVDKDLTIRDLLPMGFRLGDE